MSKTNDAARVLCPRTCLDCCCQEHHWGEYGGDEEDEISGEDNYMRCKHCPAKLSYTEPCTLCGKELIDHDLDTFDCDPQEEADDGPKFAYAGQPKRVCKQVHPWDVPGGAPDQLRGEDFRLLD